MTLRPLLIILVLLAISQLANVYESTKLAHAQDVDTRRKEALRRRETAQDQMRQPSGPEQAAQRNEEMRKRLNLPIKHPVYQNTQHRPPHHPPPENLRPWPRTTTIIRETPQPVVIINNSPPAEPVPPPKPDPKYLWVPPVMEKRTEPGHWEFGVKKTWMGDHWRFEQDSTQKTWVPEKEVDYVRQPGYWDVVAP